MSLNGLTKIRIISFISENLKLIFLTSAYILLFYLSFNYVSKMPDDLLIHDNFTIKWELSRNQYNPADFKVNNLQDDFFKNDGPQTAAFLYYIEQRFKYSDNRNNTTLVKTYIDSIFSDEISDKIYCYYQTYLDVIDQLKTMDRVVPVNNYTSLKALELEYTVKCNLFGNDLAFSIFGREVKYKQFYLMEKGILYNPRYRPDKKKKLLDELSLKFWNCRYLDLYAENYIKQNRLATKLAASGNHPESFFSKKSDITQESTDTAEIE